MSNPLDTWAGAFCLTQLVEIPIYLTAARKFPASRRWCFAAGASAITHPVVWFVFPWEFNHGIQIAPTELPMVWFSFGWESSPYLAVVLAAETFAILTEALWGRLFHVPSPFRWSLLANLSSIAAGLLVRDLW